MEEYRNSSNYYYSCGNWVFRRSTNSSTSVNRFSKQVRSLSLPTEAWRAFGVCYVTIGVRLSSLALDTGNSYYFVDCTFTLTSIDGFGIWPQSTSREPNPHPATLLPFRVVSPIRLPSVIQTVIYRHCPKPTISWYCQASSAPRNVRSSGCPSIRLTSSADIPGDRSCDFAVVVLQLAHKTNNRHPPIAPNLLSETISTSVQNFAICGELNDTIYSSCH